MRCARDRRRCAWTLVELLVALGVLSLVAVALYQFLSTIFSGRRTSAVRMTGASLLRQDARLAIEKLLHRLEEGVEISSPPPGGQAPALEFRDLLNHPVRLALTPSAELVTWSRAGGGWQPEVVPAAVPTEDGESYSPVRPVRIPAVVKVSFRAISPSLTIIELTLQDAGRTITVVATARLRNPGMVET